MGYYPKPDNYIRDKISIRHVKLHYLTIKRCHRCWYWAGKRHFIALKVEVGKLEINKLINVPTSWDNRKVEADDLDVGKLKNVPVDLRAWWSWLHIKTGIKEINIKN